MVHPKIIDVDGAKFVSARQLHNEVLDLNNAHYSRNIKEWFEVEYLFADKEFRTPQINKDVYSPHEESKQRLL